jgi:glycosyltransferase involved in cell wall biosynthesis
MQNESAPLSSDLVSVIIPSYNHGNYLSEAIESAYTQLGVKVEIIVVDDGSTDDTRLVAQMHPYVKYIFQTNQGLSAARNKGIENSTGKYLVFLDADDWLLDDSLAVNLQYLQDEKKAFVSGTYKYVFEKTDQTYDIIREVNGNHYQEFLICNYIGMHGAVMYQRWAFDHYRFDTSLKASEDYDMFLNLSRKFPVVHHTQQIAAYRIHGMNMSGNIPLMLEYTLKVLKRQEPLLQNEAEINLFHKGIRNWKNWYCGELYKKLHPLPVFTNNNSRAEMGMLWKYKKPLFLRYLARYQIKLAKWMIKKYMPAFISKRFYKKATPQSFIPPPGKVNKGDFNRTSPFSEEFGYERGGPIDRYYIEKFLAQNAPAIKGRILEIGDNTYTKRFGGSRVERSDVLNITSSPDATFVGDLSDAPHLPSNAFDCIILTQTLHLIYDYKAALSTCYSILKPGGTLLITVPGISNIDYDDWENYWLWSFTKKSVERILLEVFAGESVRVKSYGNVLVAASFLYGLGVTEIDNSQLEYTDPHYQLLITAVAKKRLKNEVDEIPASLESLSSLS